MGNFHRFVELKHSTVTPKAFPEKGLYMLATFLESKRGHGDLTLPPSGAAAFGYQS